MLYNRTIFGVQDYIGINACGYIVLAIIHRLQPTPDLQRTPAEVNQVIAELTNPENIDGLREEVNNIERIILGQTQQPALTFSYPALSVNQSIAVDQNRQPVIGIDDNDVARSMSTLKITSIR